jgi:hypothetical protein
MTQVSVNADCSAYITPAVGSQIHLSADEVRQIVDKYEFYCAGEDVKMHLTDCNENDKGGDYDYEKFPPHVVRGLAREVIERKGDSTNIQDTYAFIVDWVIEDYEKGKVTI